MTSQRVNSLTADEEVFFRRLMSHVDDYGLAEAHSGLLRAALFPLRLDRVREAHIEKWKTGCAKAGVIGLYEVGGRQFLQILNFKQQTRSANKHPLPSAEQVKTFVSSCSQPLTLVHLDGGVCVVGDEGGGGARSGRPKSVEEVRLYANQIGLAESEADKFFDHFESNGWRQGGKTPIRSWQAAARNWKRRSAEFEKNSSSSAPTGGADTKTITNQSGVPVFN